MLRLDWTLVVLGAAATAVSALPTANPPSVVLDDAIVIGTTNGAVSQYLGIPYAQPPIGNLRLRLPQPVKPYTGVVNATTFGNQCIQQDFVLPPFPDDVPEAAQQYLEDFIAIPDVPQSEDCLNLNVIAPADATPESKLPVLVWIYGGGFQHGSNAMEPGEAVVARSLEIEHPVVYVAMNYRLSAFGFLGGKEVKEAGVGNLGLQDQREAFRWVQKYISAFGGDPSKVTIWGESAGAISVSLHMLTNGGNTEGLFRAGFMESGAPGPYGDILELQGTYDQIVADSGCASANNTLQCLRAVPADVLKAAMDKTPSFVNYVQVNTPWNAHADGVFVTEPPQHLLLQGNAAKIPIVVGNDEDEGSAFAFPSLNVTTDAEFFDYVSSNFYPRATNAEIAQILDLYPADPADGSPFETGDLFAYSPQYKRISAFQGDWIEQAPRRLLTKVLSPKQPVYAFLNMGGRINGLGAPHGSELANVYGGGDMADYLIRFATNLDPNGDGAVDWPRYSNDHPQLLTFQDGAVPLTLSSATYRFAGMEFLTNLSLIYPA
ncbi:carotenoid ester lipase precursor [Trametes coccinea BRFM310]|uniref:Carboxylic ester hydrolase n=1 Tax=Trametes coccinea (strain BRFM310) TaxID=1353009 RepID=A0A1Y2IF99_TRAC3|nr:carotenoid ester lipase precursor [Trametes coccinea BRFM310]